ncbi:hypothetical protein JW935_01185 [candidate division KSB1 bacterium]|nr:hypothetical protein [candidate division KSB1 bacterium]
MAIFVIKFQVKDFETWKKAFDEHRSAREQFGIKDHFVLKSVENGSTVTVVGEGAQEKLLQFFDSAELKSAMKDAGVISAPDVFIGENKQ